MTKMESYKRSADYAWKHNHYTDWINYKLKSALGSGYDSKKNTDAMRPYVTFFAEFNPLFNLSEILSGLTGGTNMDGGEMTSSNYFSAIIGIVAPFIKKSKPISKNIGTIFNEHHLFPNQIFEEFAKKLLKMGWVQNAKKNLITLMIHFHGNHPQLNNWVRKRIKQMIKTKSLDMDILLRELKSHVRKAWIKYIESQGEQNLNDYFRNLNKPKK